MKHILSITACILVGLVLFQSCEKDLEENEYNFGFEGTIFFNSYAVKGDTLQVVVNDSVYSTTFSLLKSFEYGFVKYYGVEKDLKVSIVNQNTLDTVHTYNFSFVDDEGQVAIDTTSFYYKSNGTFIDNAMDIEAGTLSDSSNNVGLWFIFPNMNYYSHSSYEGTVDVIIADWLTGEAIDTAENVGADAFGDFVEFSYSSAILAGLVNLQIVKHGTGESYLDDGSDVTIEKWQTIQATSKLIVLEESADDNGSFEGLEANIDLATVF